ncbi:ferric reductase transmembrane component 1 [Chaetomidium leptoderma]|uniref:Ferric reductase transmembrane component 1 n=1 Tax=Chaetomidium leptoderma TaxID=669021 RepID=A0AAN6VS61_9PEZI|nr:ferric reductase transmembrane component 1 [Chaetomidium leptoderma]
MDRTQPCLGMQGGSQETLPSFVRALCHSGPAALSEDGDLDWMNDPEKVEYIRQLLESLYEARAIVASYNLVLLFVVLVVALWHWRESRSDRQKWRRLKQPLGDGIADGATSRSAASSSSNTLAGTATPDVKDVDVDVERVPLLPRNRAAANLRSRRNGVVRAVRAWLARQPPPLPVVNRTLPSNGTSLFILAWLALNVFFHFFRLPMRWDFFFIFADRTGCVFIVNLPLLYLLSAKNQPLRRLTGYSYEALNIFHRRVGELLCFEAALHFTSMILWQFLLARDWLVASRSAHVYFTHPIILCGLGALVTYELLYLTSLATFRQRWYELFLASHILLQTAALAFLWFHFPTSQPYVAVSLAIFLTDRVVYRLALNRTHLRGADLRVLDNDTYLLSADWDIIISESGGGGLLSSGWHPTDHVFLTVPALGRSHALQAHPFTIASAAPGRPGGEEDEGTNDEDDDDDDDNDNGGGGRQEEVRRRRRRGRQEGIKRDHAWLTLLIRAHDGFTRDLLRHATTTQNQRVDVWLDGPYGSPHALDMLRASGCAVVVAGGSGIAVAWPLVWALLHEGGGESVAWQSRTRRRRRVAHLLWVTHSREHREWVPGLQLKELVGRGWDLVVPEPTAEAGRPDVTGLVSGWIDSTAVEGREVGVVVSGPDGLNRAVRNVCAEQIGRGREVRVAVEKFGW